MSPWTVHGFPQGYMRGIRIPLFTCLWLIATACVLAACAGGQSATKKPGGSSTVPRVGGASGAPPAGSGTPAPSRAAALAYARAVNLTVGDIPQASLDRKRGGETFDAQEQRELRSCEGVPARSRKLAEASSPKLTRGRELETEQIRSAVEVLVDPHAVAREFAAWDRRALRECVARVLTRHFSAKSIRTARWGRFTVSKLPVDVSAPGPHLGIRVVAMLNIPFSEVSVPIYVDVLAFAAGRASVALTAASVTQPVPAATERELLALLATRASAHPL